LLHDQWIIDEIKEEIDTHTQKKKKHTKNQPDKNLNRSIPQNEIEAPIVSQKRTVQDLMDSLLNSTFKEELI
jgi:hypothetical protein